jgi:hypothetical protein
VLTQCLPAIGSKTVTVPGVCPKLVWVKQAGFHLKTR